MKTLWEDNRVDEEEVWSAIRFLDPHERAKGYEIEPEGIPIGMRVPAKAPSRLPDGPPNFRRPQLYQFNWARDYFDTYAYRHDQIAIWSVDETGSGTNLSLAEMSRRSNQVANFRREHGVRRGDRLFS